MKYIRRREKVVIAYLIARRYNLLDVKARAERLITRLSIRPAMLCTCALTMRAKENYISKVQSVQHGTKPYRTNAAI